MGFADAFAYGTAAEIFREHAALSAFENGGSRDFDIGAYADLDATGYEGLAPFQWPQPRGAASATRRFFADGRFYHADGKARFVAGAGDTEARAGGKWSFVLNTGRIRDQWHTMTRTGKSPRLSAHIAEPFAELHPADASELGIADADLVEVMSATGGRVLRRALLTERQARGAVFSPMHWTGETSSLGRVDALAPSVTDPVSGQPALKHVAVAVRRYAAARYVFAVSAARPVALDADYWSVARAGGGWRLELAGEQPPGGWEAWARQAFSVPGTAELAGYVDRSGADTRLAFFRDGRLLAALFVSDAPVAVSRNWAVALLGEDHMDMRRRTLLIAGRPGADRPDIGAIVCSCFGVGVNQIAGAVRNGCSSVEAVGAALSAGTNCGSCRPEIRRIIDAAQVLAAEW